MKLNTECVRDLLLTLEEESRYDEELITKLLQFEDVRILPRLSKYSKEDVLYTSEKLEEAGFINFHIELPSETVLYASYGQITYQGHQFLENMRDDGNWKKTKSIADKVGSVSMNVLTEIAAKVISELIAKQMGL